MTATETSVSPSQSSPQTHDQTLRIRAVVILGLLLAEILVGNQLALLGSPYPWGWLAAHIGLSIVLVAFTAHAFVISVRLPSWPARVASGVTFLSSVGATIDGILFLYGGASRSSLYGMEGLSAVAFLGCILLIFVGSVVTRSPRAGVR